MTKPNMLTRLKALALSDAIFHTRAIGQSATPYAIYRHAEQAEQAKARYRECRSMLR